MAAVTRVKPRHVAPVGYEWIDVCELTEDVAAGDLLQFTGVMSDNLPLMRKCPTGSVPDGIALKAGFAGQRGFDVGIHCEMDGFSGLTPGAKVYQSGSVAGGEDTTGAVTGVAPLGTTTNITAVPGSFADLPAVQTYLVTLRTDIEARLDAIEAKLDALIGAVPGIGAIGKVVKPGRIRFQFK